MDNVIADLMKAQESAIGLMNSLITPELRAKMTPDQLAMLDEANTAANPEALKKVAKDLENYANELDKNK